MSDRAREKLRHNHSAGTDFCPACTQAGVDPSLDTDHSNLPPERMTGRNGVGVPALETLSATSRAAAARIGEIRLRAQRATSWINGAEEVCEKDIPYLLAELERLRGERDAILKAKDSADARYYVFAQRAEKAESELAVLREQKG